MAATMYWKNNERSLSSLESDIHAYFLLHCSTQALTVTLLPYPAGAETKDKDLELPLFNFRKRSGRSTKSFVGLGRYSFVAINRSTALLVVGFQDGVMNSILFLAKFSK